MICPLPRNWSGEPGGRRIGRASLRDGRPQEPRAPVTWVHSYVSAEKQTTFYAYDAPAPQAIRKAAATSDCRDSVMQVSVVDPYFSLW